MSYLSKDDIIDWLYRDFNYVEEVDPYDLEYILEDEFGWDKERIDRVLGRFPFLFY